MNELRIKYYQNLLIQTKRGNSAGRVVNAKPILIITLFELIEEKSIIENKIFFDDSLQIRYNKIYEKYDPGNNITPIYKPYYHLGSDNYWHLRWKEGSTPKCPSAKYIRDNVEYAFFDEGFFCMVKNSEERRYFKDVVTNHFFKFLKNE